MRGIIRTTGEQPFYGRGFWIKRMCNVGDRVKIVKIEEEVEIDIIIKLEKHYEDTWFRIIRRN